MLLAETGATFIEPTLLLRTEHLLEGSRWSYELKLDGYRAVAVKTAGEVRLRSRNDSDFKVKLFSQDSELYVLAISEGRQQKEIAIRRKKLARLLRKLRRTRKSLPSRDQLLLRIGAANTEAGRAFGFVKIRVPGKDEAATRETFTFHTDRNKLKEAQLRDGHYLLRTNLVAEDPAVLWDRYIQLTQIEAAFKCLKSELGIRPIYNQLVAFLAYCLSVTLRHKASLAGSRSWTNTAGGAGEARQYTDAGRLFPDRRWALPDHVALHRTC